MMQLHLDEISRNVADGAHAVLILDRAGWHTTGKLDVPDNITPIFLPSRAPELNPVENVWQYLRQNWLSNTVFENYGWEATLLHSCGQHGGYGLRVERPAAFVQEASSSEFGGYGGRAQLSRLGFLRASAFVSLTTSGRARYGSSAPRPSRRWQYACACVRPRTWRRESSSRTQLYRRGLGARTAVGVSSAKCMGADAAMSVTPFAFSMSWPASCTIRSRAKRSGLSTMIVRAPLLIRLQRLREPRAPAHEVRAANLKWTLFLGPGVNTKSHSV